MEDKELQQIWKNVEVELPEKSKSELNLLLTSKAEQVLGKFRLTMTFSVITSSCFLFFLIISASYRQNDVLYLINNLILAIITLSAFITGIFSLRKTQNKTFDQSLKSWLESRIKALSAWLTGRFSKLYLFLLPLFYLLSVLSFYVFFSNTSLMESFQNKGALTGLLVGVPIGLFTAYFVIVKIRKYQIKNLEFLQDLHKRLCADN